MRNGKRGRYTLEFKQEAARLLGSDQSIAETARSLGVVEQTLSNWVKAQRDGRLKEVSGKAGVTAEQMEISRLRAELARVTMERDVLAHQRHTGHDPSRVLALQPVSGLLMASQHTADIP